MARISKEAKEALRNLQAVEAEHTKAAEAANEASRTEKEATDRAIALSDQRNALADKEPRLILHTNEPNPEIEDNPLIPIDAELAEIDLQDLHARTEHARKLEAKAKADLDAVIFSSYPRLEEGLAPEAEASREKAIDALNAANEALEEFAGWHHRFTHLAAQAPGLEARSVRGIEHVAALQKALRDPALPSPIPVKPADWNPNV